jgi:branched-chain amino acid transport system substrate-binding protein
VLSASLWALASGCSVLVDPQTEQCVSTADCAAKGGDFADTICREHVCTRPRCSAHEQCGERLGLARGEQGYCRPDGVCARLFTPECTRLLPADALSSEHLLFGMMAILNPASGNASYGLPHLQGVEVAVKEINDYGGLPGASPTAAARRLALLVCDHGSVPAEVARHLVNNIRVPAIVGASFSGVTTEVLDVARTRDVLVFSPAATSPALTTYDDNRNLFWRTAPSDNLQTEAMKLIVPMIEEALRKKVPAVLAPGEQLRVIMPYKGDDAGRALYNAATSLSRVVPNPAPPLTGMSYGGFEYLNPDNKEKVVPPWAMHVATVLAARPHIIIPLGTVEFVKEMMRQIETGWDDNLGYRPWYMFPEGSKDPALLTIANENPHWRLQERVIGVAPGARQPPRFPAFSARFRAALQTTMEPGNLAEYAYDAAYLLAYATAIAGQHKPTGPQLVRALGQVSCSDKPTVQAGPTDIQGSLRRAVSDGCINFEGISGPLDFDATGEAPSDYAVWCLKGSAPSVDYEPPIDIYYSYQNGLVTPTGRPPLDLSRADWCKARAL